MSMFLGLVGFFGFLVCLVLVIIALVKKKEKKKALIGLAACFVLFCVGVSTNQKSTDSAEHSAAPTAAEQEKQEKQEKKKEQKKKEQAKQKEEQPEAVNGKEEADTVQYTIPHGEVLDANPNGGTDRKTLVIKAKIESNLTKKMTIDQNFYNVTDIILKQGGDQFNEIQYWAVADMTDGSESKVIQFTVTADTIQAVAEERILPNQLKDHVEDLWILPSLQQ